MKIAVTDYTFENLELETGVLSPLGCQVVGQKTHSEAELVELVADADCVITQFAPVNARVIAAMQRARAIVRYGIGVDNVDLAAAAARGIPVCNVPDYCIDEVADHTLALLLALTRRIVANTNYIRSGKWGSAAPLTALHALKQLSVGIVGFGRIGREVASRLVAFKSPIMVFDPQVPADQIRSAGYKPAELESAAGNRRRGFAALPLDGVDAGHDRRRAAGPLQARALLINVARGDLVDTQALVDALQSGKLAGAGLDVSNPEPIPAEHPLRTLDNVVFTAHIASASVPAVSRLRHAVAETAALAVQGKTLPNVVNGVATPARR